MFSLDSATLFIVFLGVAVENLPSLSTDQVAAFVELARLGSLRLAAKSLHITEQGIRSRLLVLERRLGTELYRKSRGMRHLTPLTTQGQHFLPNAIAFLQRARELSEMFTASPEPREITVLGSQYLTTYVLIDAVRRFHIAHPGFQVRLSTRTEHDIEEALRGSTEFALGVAAPYEPSPDLEYSHLFSMTWSVITPQRHPLLKRKTIRLRDLIQQPLILYERGSTGRQHVIEAFQHEGHSPRVEMEATTTDLIVRMVESGLGVSIVPLLPTGAVTRGRRVGIRDLGRQIRPIDSGLLIRKGERLSEASRRFIEFVIREAEKVR